MFYSQFILAKKGPLGTIWIAAHLERKLRKNQVADTDIGFSVDTILSPEVPIALRLSSHLLVGVVRIYSRKVNYLFDDCSEALLKIKQAFRSTTVDLPPEESKAPYHSITLPETFDLDDFELPDNENFQGNYVDHHTSTKEQITLQDNMEGVVYSTSQFGLDERFGDGETSGLKLDEEAFFLHKVDSAGPAGVSDDHRSFAEAETLMQDDDHGGLPALPDYRVENLNVERDLMDYAQAPSTPGLVETPNLVNIQEISACEDHMDYDDNLLVDFTLNRNSETISKKLSQHQENSQLVDLSLSYDKISLASGDVPCEEKGNNFIDPETETRPSPNETRAQNILFVTSFAVADEAQGSGQMAVSVSTFLDKKQDLENVIFEGDDVNVPSFSNEDYREYNVSVFNRSAQNDLCPISSQQMPECVLDDNQTTPFREKIEKEVSGNLDLCVSSNGGALELSFEHQGLSSLENLEDNHLLNVSVRDETTYPTVHNLRPCSTADLGLPNSSPPVNQVSNDLNMAPGSFEGGETIHTSGLPIVGQDDKFELDLDENHTAEPVSVEDIHVGSGKSDDQMNNVLEGGSVLENAMCSVNAVFPEPEKLLSLPEGHNSQLRSSLLETTPRDVACVDESDAGSRIISRKKRSYTASTLTEQSLYSVESARVSRTKRTSRAIPDDDDLLSSILVGRSSSVLKVKPTPPPYEMTSRKRQRYTPRISVSKRKVLMDDTMGLHGDTIRQQLINTDDIRRLRKKAPCTLPEISSIEKQYLEDELFIQPLSTGVSVALVSLFNQGYDLSIITVSKDEANVVSVLSTEGSKNVPDSAPNVVETDVGEFAAAEENCDSQLNDACELTENKLDEGHETRHSIIDLETINLKENKEKATEPIESLLDISKEIEGTNMPFGVTQLTSPVLGVEPGNVVETDAVVVSVDSKIESENGTKEAVSSFDSKIESDNVMKEAVSSFDSKIESENVMNEAVSSFDDKLEPENVMEAAVPIDDHRESENVVQATVSCDNITELQIVVTNVFETRTTVEVESNERDAILSDGTQLCAGSIEFSRCYGEQMPYDATNTSRGDYNESSCGGTSSQIFTPLNPSQIEDMQGSCLDNKEYLTQHEAPHPTVVAGSEILDIDMEGYNDFNYVAAANDTDFLNVDEDDEAEFTDDYIPNAEETRITDNSGWSSRTRAVASYLQTLFMKEAEHDRKVLPMDNLLLGKTRKEASRMFFEALVLKSKDYIQVEQECSFKNINVKPKMKLLKSDF